MSSPVWFITAASSGFGKEIALNALKKGDRVIATGRSLNKLAEVKEAGAEILVLNVTEAHAKYGRLDILVNSAGYILEAAIEEARLVEEISTKA
jgi:NADP-dependent 3-hydroxy acid dehydrogenase YdfG